MKYYPVMTSSGDLFWRDVERHADVNGLSTHVERLAHFHHAIVPNAQLMRWYETTVKPRLPDITLEELQDAFFAQTLNPYWLSVRLIILCQMAYREAELLRNFNNRFAEAAVNGRFDDSTDQPICIRWVAH
jgi:hypothetical protein